MTDAEKTQEALNRSWSLDVVEKGKTQEAWTKYCDGLPVPALGQVVPWYSVEHKAGFQAGYQAAKSESPWVPIADIPEEWKDGREVLLWLEFTEWCAGWYCRHNNSWIIIDESGSSALDYGEIITYAMLPPNPPKEG